MVVTYKLYFYLHRDLKFNSCFLFQVQRNSTSDILIVVSLKTVLCPFLDLITLLHAGSHQNLNITLLPHCFISVYFAH